MSTDLSKYSINQTDHQVKQNDCLLDNNNNFLAKSFDSKTVNKTIRGKILWGVCGIGRGHALRQLPLIEHFLQTNDIVIFCYGESYSFYLKYFSKQTNITVVLVAVPFFVGNKEGIDFKLTAQLPKNQLDYLTINKAAFEHAQKTIKLADLVVSDYEPVSAQYAYTYNIPLVTVDQQSKYLVGEFDSNLNGFGYKDEVERLRLFFPKAQARLACSFFKVPGYDRNRSNSNSDKENVQIFPPIFNNQIQTLKRELNSDKKSVLIYISAQQELNQSFEQIVNVCANFPQIQFDIFGKNILNLNQPNITSYAYDNNFYNRLKTCSAIITTAGHGLLSEAMLLKIPVYAIPLPVYEQQMNAQVIDTNQFGLSGFNLNYEQLDFFLNNIENFSQNIQNDKSILLRGCGKQMIIDYLKQWIR